MIVPTGDDPLSILRTDVTEVCAAYYARMRKLLIVSLTLVTVVAAGCSNDDKKASGPSGPQTYTVDLDANAPPLVQVAAYYPGLIAVRPGDTVTFQAKSKDNPHTITFGVAPDHSNAPAPVVNNGKNINPAEFLACYTGTPPTPTISCPPPPPSAPAYNGNGFWNSGWISQAIPGAPNSATLKLSSSIAPGDYRFICLLHPLMAGTVKVVAKDSERLSPAAVRASADAAATQAVAAAQRLKPPSAASGTVSAGWGDNVVAVMGFDPSPMAVKAGDTVTWKPGSPYEPHTVTFESPFKSPGEEGATLPLGVPSGGTYTSGATSSGIFGPKPYPFPADSFSLKFTKAGTYDYVCVLHPGMKGTVTVT
jgi:plastocyanin